MFAVSSRSLRRSTRHQEGSCAPFGKGALVIQNGHPNGSHTTNRLVCCEIKNRETNNKEISKRELSFLRELSFKNLSFKNSIVFRSISIELFNGYVYGTIFIGLFS